MCGNSAWAYACLGNLTCGCLHVLANLHTYALCVHMCGVFAGYCVHSCVLTNDTCMSTCVCLHEHMNVACICTAWERAMCIHICVFYNQLRDRWVNVSTCTARPIFQCIVNHTIIHNTTQGIVSRFMLFVSCDKSKILHCKKAWSNHDMRFLQWCLNIHKLDGLYHKNSARTQHSCHYPIPIPYPIHLMPKKNICPLYLFFFTFVKSHNVLYLVLS